MPAPDGYSFRPLTLDDAEALAAAYTRNREHLARWDPERDEEFFTPEGQALQIGQRLERNEHGLFEPYVIEGEAGAIVGCANIQNIVRGPMQSGVLGYWVDRDHLRRGLAASAVEFLEGEAVARGLHRLEAGTQVENVPSQRVLLARGFEQYGVAPGLLYLNGAWRDHVLFQKLLNDDPPPAAGGS